MLGIGLILYLPIPTFLCLPHLGLTRDDISSPPYYMSLVTNQMWCVTVSYIKGAPLPNPSGIINVL